MSAGTITPAGQRRQGAWTIGIVGSAHFTSHFLQLSFAPLLPILHNDLGGVLSGGYLADRVRRHERVVATGLTLGALLMFAAAYPALPIAAVIGLLACAGFSSGATKPARDLLIRHAAPPGGLGKAFGMVYSGLDVGSLIAPVAYGSLLDRNLDNLVFVVSGALVLLATLTIFRVYSQAARQRSFDSEAA
ncbi:MAG: MFS transporter [Hyphomicrobiales bacterium]|nr:MFS transporter [Hyphomicrobiales bacterium]